MYEEEALGKAYDGRLMRRLLRYLRPHRRAVLVAFVALLAHSGLQLVQPLLTKIAIDDYIATGDLDGVATIGLVFLLVLVLSFGFEYLETWTMQMTGQRIMYDLRLEIFRHLQRLGLRFYDRNPVGRLMTRVTSDVDVLNELFVAGVVAVFGDLATLVGIMVVLVVMDWRLALVAFAVLPVIALITHWFRRHARDSYRQVRVLIARINAFLQENLVGTSTVQLFVRESSNSRRFDDINRQHRDANITAIFYYAVFYPAVELMSAVAGGLIVWVGGGWVLQDFLTLGALVAFLQYSQRFFRPISDLSEKFNILQASMASSERIFGLLDTPVPVEQAPAIVVRDPRGHIVFDDVSFAYRGDDLVLRNVSFEVRPGERVGVVGATGAGKSTLFNLLLGFYPVTRGRIVIDGVDLERWDEGALRRLFGLVLQDVHLFTGTIASNVRLGRDDVTDEQVRRATAAVHADRFIERMPLGYDTVVAERGATLSVGQKQLLSFARALTFDPRVLLLDEATSSVDTETEVLIQDGLRVLMTGRTTIAIAHRLSTIHDTDTILVLHKGEIREQGTHAELLAARGIYHRLYLLQYREQNEGGRMKDVGWVGVGMPDAERG